MTRAISRLIDDDRHGAAVHRLLDASLGGIVVVVMQRQRRTQHVLQRALATAGFTRDLKPVGRQSKAAPR